MPEPLENIKRDALARSVENAPEAGEKILVLDRRRFAAGAALDLVDRRLVFDQPSHVVFVDPLPMMNYSHPCHYLVYNAENGGSSGGSRRTSPVTCRRAGRPSIASTSGPPFAASSASGGSGSPSSRRG